MLPTRLREMGQNYPFEQRLSVFIWCFSMCTRPFPCCSVPPQPHSRAGGEHPTRILCVVSPEPGDCGFSAKLQQHPAQGLIQQRGHPGSVLRATDILFTLLQPLLHGLAHLLEWDRQLFVPQPAAQLPDPHFPQVTLIMLLAQNTAVWQRRANRCGARASCARQERPRSHRPMGS